MIEQHKELIEKETKENIHSHNKDLNNNNKQMTMTEELLKKANSLSFEIEAIDKQIKVIKNCRKENKSNSISSIKLNDNCGDGGYYINLHYNKEVANELLDLLEASFENKYIIAKKRFDELKE